MRLLALTLLVLGACTGRGPAPDDVLTIGAYTAPREALDQAVIPAFRRAWKARTGREVAVRASYLGSGAQARAVIDGFEADVVILALEGDVDKIAQAGAIRPDWRAATGADGLVARSLVAIAVRKGNPLGIRDFADLARPGVEVLTPNPRTSGAAMWNVVALYGADHDLDRVRAVMRNVSVMDKGARESLVNFERGIGDAAITYEQELTVAHLAGRDEDLVVPPETLVVEIPAAVVDRTVDQRGTRTVAEAFLAFVLAPEGQAALARFGFRSAKGPLDVPARLFTIRTFGGWEKVKTELFGPAGKMTRVIEEAQ